MKGRPILISVLALGLMLALAAGLSLAQVPEPQGSVGIQAAPVGTGFTYQGRLTDGGSPANGIYDFEFKLYDAASSGTQVGSTIIQDDVAVTDGLFTVELNFGSGIFTGDARWLEIGVRPGASAGAYTTLTPRQMLTPTPYALALPGLWTQQNATSPNLIGGFSGNEVTAGVVGAAISGGGLSGFLNRVTDDFGTVGGGANNQAGNADADLTNARDATVSGGRSNTASGGLATVGGGSYNAASGDEATVGGGSENEASGGSSAVGGGHHNMASGDYATIAGGVDNAASGTYATVGGGNHNVAEAAYAIVGGGLANSADGEAATVGGGYNNLAEGDSATVGGGKTNQAMADYATIAGGGRSDPTDFTTGNRVTDNYGTVGGGGNNQAGDANTDLTDAIYATIGGGEHNTASGRWATVSGGLLNTASGDVATVGGGYGSTASDYATVGGGIYNDASGRYATVAGGDDNTASGNSATVGGGSGNAVNGPYATIGGGEDNTASNNYATVGGGVHNIASEWYTTVSGGYYNTASGSAATVGGYNNEASGDYATVGGGVTNTASGYAASVGGGAGNTLSGDWATVPGGIYNTAQGDYSFAAGRRAKANNQGCFVWGDSADADIACDNDNRWVARASGGVYFYTSSDLSTGAYLAAGSSSWTPIPSPSDRNLKENFVLVDGQEVLERLAEISITTWNYKAQDRCIRHMGPVAQDFYAAFGVGENDKHIGAMDANGVALAAIQGLYAQNQALEAENAALQGENAVQQEQIDDLEARLGALEQAMTVGDTPMRPAGLPVPGWLFGGLLLAGLVLGQRWHAGGRA